LQKEVADLDNRLLASETDPESRVPSDDLPSQTVELELLAIGLKEAIEDNDNKIVAAENDVKAAELEIDGTPDSEAASGRKNAKPKSNESTDLSVREQQVKAKEVLSALTAAAEVRRGELERMLTAEQIEQEIGEAQEMLRRTRSELETAKLSESEKTIRDRLDAADVGLRAPEERLAEAQRDFHQIEGAFNKRRACTRSALPPQSALGD
jgi:hypothetical protein